MKYLLIHISSVALVTIGTIALPTNISHQALAIGCDTYERIRGEIGSCTGGTTNYNRELWLERYSVCLKQQLSTEIATYNNQTEASYVEWDKNNKPDMNLENIALLDQNTEPLAISQMQSTTNPANDDLCN